MKEVMRVQHEMHQDHHLNIELNLINNHENLHVWILHHPRTLRADPFFCIIKKLLFYCLCILTCHLSFEIFVLHGCCCLESSFGEYLKERLPVELTIFKLYKGGIFGILISESFNSNHATHGIPLPLLAKTFIAMYSNDLSKPKILLNFLFFRHLDITNLNIIYNKIKIKYRFQIIFR